MWNWKYKIFYSVDFSPQANYTDWATAAGGRILVPTFADRGVARGQRGGTRTALKSLFSLSNSGVYINMSLGLDV
jgi:hypothetical protein